MTKKKDFIRIKGLQIFAHHGVFAFEKEKGQPFVVNAVLYTDLSKAGTSDLLTESTHYGEVCEQIKKSLTEKSYDLLEKAAEKAVRDILIRFPLVEEVTLELEKPQAPIEMEFETVSVCITRGWNKAYIAFGSNMGDRKKYIEDALKGVKANSCFRHMKVSDYYTTTPYGGVEQDNFVNGVMEVETLLNPWQLLDFLHELEQRAGRVRQIHWGPRTLDMDILFYDQEIVDEEELIIPHQDMANRDFVLVPLMQLAPQLRHPITKKRVKDMAAELKEKHVIG